MVEGVADVLRGDIGEGRWDVGEVCDANGEDDGAGFKGFAGCGGEGEAGGGAGERGDVGELELGREAALELLAVGDEGFKRNGGTDVGVG